MANQQPPTPDSKTPLPEYYYNLPASDSLLPKLRNLDDCSDFTECKLRLGNEDTENFVVDFDDNGAWCAFDVEKDELSSLLDKDVCRVMFAYSHL